MQIEFDEQTAQEVRDIAATLHQSPEQVAQDVVANGIYLLRRYAYLKRGSETVDVPKVIEMLRSRENNHPPDPGDEIPDDLKYLLEERGR